MNRHKLHRMNTREYQDEMASIGILDKSELKKAPLIGDYEDSIEHDHAKTIKNIKQLEQRDGAIHTERNGLNIFSVGNKDFHDKGKEPFGWHYMTHNNTPNGTPIAYAKVVRGDDPDIENGMKGPYIPQAYVAQNHRGKNIHQHLVAHASDYHNGTYSDSSLSPAANQSYVKLAEQGRAKLSPTHPTHDLRNDARTNALSTNTSDYDVAADSQHFVAPTLNKAPISFEADETTPYKNVWRMQHKDNRRGPYVKAYDGEGEKWWDYEHGATTVDPYGAAKTDKKHPIPQEDKFNKDDLKVFKEKKPPFAFESAKQLKQWFSNEERQRLFELGYKPTKVKAKKIWTSGKQAFFDPHESEFNKSELQKMSRPALKLPNLGVSTRPDQDVQLLETGKHANIYGRKVANYRMPNSAAANLAAKHPHLPKELFYKQTQALREKDAKSTANKFNSRTLGLNFETSPSVMTGRKPKSFQSALAGKLRSKHEPSDTLHQEKLKEHDEKRKQIIKDYGDQMIKWRFNAPHELQFPNRWEYEKAWNKYYDEKPAKPKMPKTPAKRATKTQDLSRPQMKLRGNSVDSTVHHEAIHGLMDQVGQKYGSQAQRNLLDHLMSHYDPETLTHLKNYVSDVGYKPNSEHFKEEMFTHARDLLVNANKRKSFFNSISNNNKSDSAMDSAATYWKVMKNLKQHWQKAHEKAKAVTPEFLMGPNTPKE